MAPRTVYANLTDGLQPFSLWDQSLADMGSLGTTPCTATGTNAITLTPLPNAFAPNPAYSNRNQFSFVAAATSTGPITAKVSPLAFLNVYRYDGVTQATTGDVVINGFYGLAFSQALNSNAGGFYLLTLSAGSSDVFPLPQNDILVGNASGIATPVAMSGDASIVSSGAVTVTKTSGVAFAPSATTDTTNAANISSGLLGLARGGLAASQAAATINQIPVFPGSGGGAAPTSLSTWFDAVGSTTVGQAWVRLTGGWGMSSLGYANPAWWGATPGASDSTSALNSAIATGLPVRWPAGSFTLNSAISVTLANGAACFAMSGAGSNLTKLNWPNASGGITINAQSILNNVIITGVQLTTSQVGSGTAINMQGVGSNGNPWSIIDDVLITGSDFAGSSGSDYWSVGINVFNWGDVYIFRTNTSGPINSTGGGVGLQYGGKAASTSYATILNVISCSFNFASPGISLQNYWQGVSVINCNFNGISGSAGIQQAGSATGTLALLYVAGCQFNTKGNQIDINTAIDTVTVLGNTITCATNSAQGIALNASTFVQIVGNFFNLSGSPTSTFGVTTTGATGTVVGNVFQNVATGVNLQTGSSHWTVGLNAYSSVATPVTDTPGTNNVGTFAGGHMTGVVP